MQKVVFNWSGGKDSSLCLYKLLQQKQFQISCLLTTVNENNSRVSMHGVRTELLQQQAESIGIPSLQMNIPEMPDINTYNESMIKQLRVLQKEGINISVFGDIFLEDLKKYREDKLALVGMKGLFPLWKLPTRDLINEFIDLGFKAIVVCVNDKYLDKKFLGRIIDRDFIRDLPANVDVCGENGEYHSFVFEGPVFKKKISFSKGKTVYKKYASPEGNLSSNSPFINGFWFLDLLPDKGVRE